MQLDHVLFAFYPLFPGRRSVLILLNMQNKMRMKSSLLIKIGSCCIGFLSTSPRGGDLFSFCVEYAKMRMKSSLFKKIGSGCIGFLPTSPRGGDLFSSCLTGPSHAGRHKICQTKSEGKVIFDNENCLYHNGGKVGKGNNTSNIIENNKSRSGLVPKNKVITFGDFQLGSGGRKFLIEILFP